MKILNKLIIEKYLQKQNKIPTSFLKIFMYWKIYKILLDLMLSKKHLKIKNSPVYLHKFAFFLEPNAVFNCAITGEIAPNCSLNLCLRNVGKSLDFNWCMAVVDGETKADVPSLASFCVSQFFASISIVSNLEFFDILSKASPDAIFGSCWILPCNLECSI